MVGISGESNPGEEGGNRDDIHEELYGNNYDVVVGEEERRTDDVFERNSKKMFSKTSIFRTSLRKKGTSSKSGKLLRDWEARKRQYVGCLGIFLGLALYLQLRMATLFGTTEPNHFLGTDFSSFLPW